jgi:Flp pilus assembly protein TadG
MRVLMNARPDRSDDERGAVAIMVGILSTFLLVLASFTVDVGLAYTYKRQAQTAADAAVLAATSLYVDSKVTCDNLDDNLGLNADAKELADEMLQKNLPGVVGTEWDVSCDNDDAELRVSYTATNESPLSLGRIALIPTT